MAQVNGTRKQKLTANWASVLISIFIVFVCLIYYWNVLSVGSLQGSDEYRTLDRSNGFTVWNDWLTVYSENSPTFRKPPLQYWLTALSLNHFSDITFAARLASFVFGFGLAVATGILACLLNQDNPYSGPSAILILSGSLLFWQSTISAMLDTGMVFFTTVAVIATLLALRNPIYWYLVSVATGAGALQKTPIALLIVVVILALLPLTKRYHGISLSTILVNNHFKIASIVTVIIVCFWPALQFIQYGSKALKQAYVSQMLERFNPFGQPGRHKDWTTIFFGREAIVWIPALLSVAALPFIFRRFPAFIPAVVVFAFMFLVSMASGNVYDRYTLLILPFLAASLAALAAKVLPGVLCLFLAIGLCLVDGGPFKSVDALGLTGNSQDQYKLLFEKLRVSLSTDEQLIMCDWPTHTSRYPPIWAAALSYYGSKGHRIYSLKRPDDLINRELAGKIRPPYRGLCSSQHFEQLKPWLAEHEIIEQSNGYVLWTSTVVTLPQ